MRFLLPLLALSACGGAGANLEGSVGGIDFEDVNVVFFGGPFIFFSNVTWSCLDVYWVSRTYNEGSEVADGRDFSAIQFAYSDPEVAEGLWNVAGEAAVSSAFLSQQGGALRVWEGRGGSLDVVSVDDDFVDGSFNITFEAGAVSGTFTAEWCRNLKDN
ncbi:MAG: hypothetical protein JXB39_14225 [Deltaproteobacteria bacterium]|nr:hypothetical protein [Deltaproteobacteria bacterium]